MADIPGLVVIVAVVVVIAAIGIGAYLVMRGSPADRTDRGPYSSGAETTGSFAVFGATHDDGAAGGPSEGNGGGGDGGGGD